MVLSIRFVIVGIFDVKEDWAWDFLVSPIVEVEMLALVVVGTFGVVVNPFWVGLSIRLESVGIFDVDWPEEDWVWVKRRDVVVWFIGIDFVIKLVFKFTIVGALGVVVNPFRVLDVGVIVEL